MSNKKIVRKDGKILAEKCVGCKALEHELIPGFGLCSGKWIDAPKTEGKKPEQGKEK